jgi:hypothetical protein
LTLTHNRTYHIHVNEIGCIFKKEERKKKDYTLSKNNIHINNECLELF